MLTAIASLFLFGVESAYATLASPRPTTGPSDYIRLFKACEGNSCCEASVRDAKKSSGYVLTNGETSCPDGYQFEMLKCMGSIRWCEKKTK